MATFLRKLWRNKPPPSVMLDWGNPLARYFAAVYAINEGGGATLYDAVSRSGAPITNGTLSQGTLTFSATTGQRAVMRSTPLIGTSDYTLCAIVRSSAAYNGYGLPAITERAASGNNIINVSIYGSSGPQQNTAFCTWRNDAGDLSQISATKSLRDGLPHFVAVTKRGTDLRIFIDGKQEATATTSSTNTLTNAGRELWIGADKGDSSALYNGGIQFAGVALTALSPDALASLSENPWQIFQPVRRLLYVDMGAGITTITADSSWATQMTQPGELAWATQKTDDADLSWAIQNATAGKDVAWGIQKTQTADAAWDFVTPQTVTADVAWQIDSPIDPAQTPIPAGLERNKTSLFSTTTRAEDGNVYNRRDN
ncbi:MAG: hypothetical protein FD177_209 [Desulfovibrionaceae bacterium]|nr:MAG: hypothetical protein FD177_209 [Desulfovibrionaceae bacterium]